MAIIEQDKSAVGIRNDVNALALSPTDFVVQGREYLSTFHKGLLAATPQLIQVSGDSTTEGDFANGVTPDVIIADYLRAKGFAQGLTVQNRGHSGGTAGGWRTPTTGFLATDLALDPTFYIIRGWGLNGPTNQSAAANAAAQLANIESGLQQIRASRDWISLPVMLCGPNSVYDDAAYRTDEYLRLMDDGCRALAKEYFCAYFSTYKYMKDANIPGSTAVRDRGWIYEDYNTASDRFVHPTQSGNYTLIAGLCEAILPASQMYAAKNKFFNVVFDGTTHDVTATTLLNNATYPFGISFFPAFSSDGFPLQGVVETYKHASGYGWQRNYFAGDTGLRVARRFYNISGSAWGSWRYENVGETQDFDYTNLTITSPWEAGTAVPACKKKSDRLHLKGWLKYVSGSFANNTVVAQLPNSVYFPNSQKIVMASHQKSGGYTGTCTLSISSAGTITIFGATDLVANDLIFLDDVSFDTV